MKRPDLIVGKDDLLSFYFPNTNGYLHHEELMDEGSLMPN